MKDCCVNEAGEQGCATLLYLVGVMGFWPDFFMGCSASDAVGWLWLWWCCHVGLVLTLVMCVTFCWQDYMVLVAQLEHQYKGVSLSCLNASPGQVFAIYMTLYAQLEHQSSIVNCSRPGICYSHNTIVIAGASVQRGESFMFECFSRPGTKGWVSNIWTLLQARYLPFTAGPSVQRGESVIVNTAPGQVFTIHMTEQPQVEVSSEVWSSPHRLQH